MTSDLHLIPDTQVTSDIRVTSDLFAVMCPGDVAEVGGATAQTGNLKVLSF